MPAEISDVRRGMDVYGFDGEKIGKVLEVQAPAAEGGAEETGDTISMDAAGATVAPPGDPSAVMGGTVGAMPLGTTTDKGRGNTTTTRLVAGRGEVPTTASDRGITPGQAVLNQTEDVPGTAPTGRGDVPVQLEGAGIAPSATSGGTETSEAYLLVQDEGVLGVGATGLRVPFSAVTDVVPGERITLDCRRADAAMRYGPGRPSLDIDEDADVTPY